MRRRAALKKNFIFPSQLRPSALARVAKRGVHEPAMGILLIVAAMVVLTLWEKRERER